MAQIPLPAGEMPRNQIRSTEFTTIWPPPAGVAAQSVRFLGTDWTRLIRNCFLGAASLFVIGAGVSVLLSVQSNSQPAVQTPAVAQTTQPAITRTVPAPSRPATVPANLRAQHAVYTVSTPEPRVTTPARLQPFYQPRQSGGAYDQRSDLRAAQPRSCPNVPLLPDPDF